MAREKIEPGPVLPTADIEEYNPAEWGLDPENDSTHKVIVARSEGDLKLMKLEWWIPQLKRSGTELNDKYAIGLLYEAIDIRREQLNLPPRPERIKEEELAD